MANNQQTRGCLTHSRVWFDPKLLMGNGWLGLPYRTDGLVVVVIQFVWANTGALLRSERNQHSWMRFSSKLTILNQPCLWTKGCMYNHVKATCSGFPSWSSWSTFGWCLRVQMFAGTFPQVALFSHSVSFNGKLWGWEIFWGIWTTSILSGLLASVLDCNPQLPSGKLRWLWKITMFHG